jgi:hypothetical protein
VQQSGHPAQQVSPQQLLLQQPSVLQHEVQFALAWVVVPKFTPPTVATDIINPRTRVNMVYSS